jgi:hypothetical protein
MAYGQKCLAFAVLDFCEPGMARRAPTLEFRSRLWLLHAIPVSPLCFAGYLLPLFYSHCLFQSSVLSGHYRLAPHVAR